MRASTFVYHGPKEPCLQQCMFRLTHPYPKKRNCSQFAQTHKLIVAFAAGATAVSVTQVICKTEILQLLVLQF